MCTFRINFGENHLKIGYSPHFEFFLVPVDVMDSYATINKNKMQERI